jgi:Domain of unknown function (DUF1996)
VFAGDLLLRAKKTGSMTICYRCLAKGDRMTGGSGAPCSNTDIANFPAKPCLGGIRATVIFLSCWDGTNLESPDHTTHVTYAAGAALAGDKCLSTHPVRIPQVTYEVMYDTSGFADLQYFKNGKQPLVYSFGDPLVLCFYPLYVKPLTLDTVLDTVRTAITSLVEKTGPFSALWMLLEQTALARHALF